MQKVKDPEMATPPSSPTRTEPMSPKQSLVIEHRNVGGSALCGIGMPKIIIIAFTYLVLIGGLGYFISKWLQIPGLTEQVDRLTGQVDRLKSEVDRLETQNDIYADLNNKLNVTSKELNASVTELTVQVDELEELNQDLNSVALFLNETAGRIDQSYEAITKHLADQIEANKVLVLANTESLMKEIVAEFSCTYKNIYLSEDWGKDFSLVIPNDAWVDVKSHVYEDVLEELCLDEGDFVGYFGDEYSVRNSENLLSALNVYTKTAIDWYYPEQGESGLTYEDWSAASFKCKNLTTKFTMSLVSR